MNILISDEVFDNQSQKSDLSYLIKTIVRKKHTIVFDAGYAEAPRWLNQDDRESLEDYFQSSMIGDPPQQSCKVVNDASAIHLDKTFGIQEAIDYVSSPLIVLVENSRNDKPLVLRALDLYTDVKSAAYFERRLDFGHAGGCGSIESVISEKLSQYGDRIKMLRYFVILDSDKRFDTHEVIKYDDLKIFLRAKNIPYHIWEKRCMENYLPVECFPKYPSNSQWINSFKSLSPLQRDFFNISGGFRADIPEDNLPEIKADYSNLRSLMRPGISNFYSDVSDHNLSTLAKGYNLPSFKENFPKGFDSPAVTRERMDKIQEHQPHPNELKSLALSIINLL